MIFGPLFAWLAGKVGGLWADVIGVVAIAAIVIAPFAYTYHAGKSNCETANAEQQLQARVDTLQLLTQIQHKGDVVAGDYVLRRGAAQVIYQTLIKEVPRATSTYKPSPTAPAQPLPRCVFTHDFVGVWNHSLEAGNDAGGLPASAGSVPPAVAAPGSVGDSDLLESGVSQRDVLDNHVVNAAACVAAEQWHDAVMEWDKQTYGGSQ